MIFLCCESSTLLGSVAVFKDQTLLAYRESPRQGSHSDVLNVFTQQVLDEAKLNLVDIDLFVSGIGPGSFTGIRISLNAIKTFAYCFNKKVLGINSLEILAEQCPKYDLPIIAMINAYKNMVYIATFEKSNGSFLCSKAPEVVRVQNLDQYIKAPVYVVGDGYLVYQKYFSPQIHKLIQRPEASHDEPSARAVAEIVLRQATFSKHWSELLPLYLRASEAEENIKGIKFQPLV